MDQKSKQIRENAKKKPFACGLLEWSWWSPLWQNMASYTIGVRSVLIWISPEEIANQSGVWDVCWAHDALDLISRDSPQGPRRGTNIKERWTTRVAFMTVPILICSQTSYLVGLRHVDTDHEEVWIVRWISGHGCNRQEQTCSNVVISGERPAEALRLLLVPRSWSVKNHHSNRHWNYVTQWSRQPDLSSRETAKLYAFKNFVANLHAYKRSSPQSERRNAAERWISLGGTRLLSIYLPTYLSNYLTI